jgi:hypothetical protein
MSSIVIEKIENAEGRKQFVRVPKSIHDGNGSWIFPLELDALERVDTKKNAFFEFGEAAFWVAKKDGKLVGRISAQVNQRHLDKYNDKCGHFGYLDGIDDPEVFGALTSTAEDWLKTKGMERVKGPYQLSINEESGMLIDGFEDPPALLMGHAEPYYKSHTEGAGYSKAKDLHAFKVDVKEERNPRIQRMLNTDESQEITVRQLDVKRLKEEMSVVFDIFSDAWSENWGYVPFSKSELEHMADSMKLILKPELALIAEVNGKPAGMLICLPNVNEAISDLDGKLFPTGLLKLIWRLKVKGLKSGRVLLAGVCKEHHSSVMGLMCLGKLFSVLEANALKLGYDYCELSWILEDNKPTQRLLQLGGYKPYKTYRIFEKELV